MDMPRDLHQIELLSLVALARLGDEAYGVTVREEIARLTGRDVSMAAVYAALDRLERRKLVKPWLSAPRAERGGRARRQFSHTAAGGDRLAREREVAMRTWSGLTFDSGRSRR
jgi:DNA-binding PadR family transcriptional regulator